MNARPYSPGPGTVPHRVIQHLRALKPGTELSTSDLAALANFEQKQAAALLGAALKAGALARRTDVKSRQMLWRLGDGKPLQAGAPIEGRPRAPRPERSAPPAPRAYERGFFTALIRQHRWPPMFESGMDPNPQEAKRSEAAVRGRATQLSNGYTGSIQNGLSRKSAQVQPSIEKASVVVRPVGASRKAVKL